MKDKKKLFIDEESIPVVDKALRESFISNPAFPFLISFERTGSHWLRMIMELYFEKPSLVRIFYYRNADQFSCYHTHDKDLEVRRDNVIYLYRNPVDTVYSAMVYDRENVDDRTRIRFWAEKYGHHLQKWLIEESFTKKKVIVTYEGMKKDMSSEFQRLCRFFSVPFNEVRLLDAKSKVTKEAVNSKVVHDPQVMNLSREYGIKKQKFRGKQTELIMDCIYSVCSAIEKYL